MGFRIDKYRNVYIKREKIPYQWLTGKNILYYTGSLITNVKERPKDYDKDKDYYFSCDCSYPKWKEIRKI